MSDSREAVGTRRKGKKKEKAGFPEFGGVGFGSVQGNHSHEKRGGRDARRLISTVGEGKIPEFDWGERGEWVLDRSTALESWLGSRGAFS